LPKCAPSPARRSIPGNAARKQNIWHPIETKQFILVNRNAAASGPAFAEWPVFGRKNLDNRSNFRYD
jgi:hypothetical protein